MKKLHIVLFMALFILCAVSNTFAFQSVWDRIEAGQEEGKSVLEVLTNEDFLSTSEETINLNIPILNNNGEYRTENKLTVDSLQIFGEIDENTQSLLQFINGLELTESSQTGDVPMQSFSINLAEKELLSYNGQLTTPYYISSNFLGDQTYMIYPEDQFEEKLTASLYKLLESISDTGSSDLPDIESVYAMIRAFRDSSNSSIITSNSMETFGKNLNANAFAPVLMEFLTRFKETEPETRNEYMYTDIPRWSRKYVWPEMTELPAFQLPVSALSAVFMGQDIEKLLDCLPQFFADNPEFTAMLNQQIRSGLIKSNPELAEAEGFDYVNELLPEIKQSIMTDFQNAVISVRFDNDKQGNTVLTSVEISRDDNTAAQHASMIISWHSTKEISGSVTEVAIDGTDQNQRVPLFRLLSVDTPDGEDSGTKTINFGLYDIADNEMEFEYVQSTDYYLASTMARVSDSDFQFSVNDENGSGTVFKTDIPNEFGAYDTTTQVTYDHISKGNQMFSVGLTSERNMVEPKLVVSESEAIPASQMSEQDYDTLASTIFVQLLTIMMSLN